MRWPCSGSPGPPALRRLPRARGTEPDSIRQLAPARLDSGGADGDPGLPPGPGPVPAARVLAGWELSPGHRQRGRLPDLGPARRPTRPRSRGPRPGRRPPPGNRRPACWRSAAGMGRSACWPRRPSTPVEELPAEGDVAVLAFSRDGRRLAWGGATEARVWDREKKRYSRRSCRTAGRWRRSPSAPTGSMLATSARDLKARVFRVASDQSGSRSFLRSPMSWPNTASITAVPTASPRDSRPATRSS